MRSPEGIKAPLSSLASHFFYRIGMGHLREPGKGRSAQEWLWVHPLLPIKRWDSMALLHPLCIPCLHARVSLLTRRASLPS